MRKLQKTGEDGQSYMVTLPKGLVESLGWREHQKLQVHKYADKLVIEDWPD
jgi:hypothetical protein